MILLLYVFLLCVECLIHLKKVKLLFKSHDLIESHFLFLLWLKYKHKWWLFIKKIVWSSFKELKDRNYLSQIENNNRNESYFIFYWIEAKWRYVVRGTIFLNIQNYPTNLTAPFSNIQFHFSNSLMKINDVLSLLDTLEDLSAR